MESLERLQRQLDGLDDLRAVVRTMKALSAASIRQYEQATEALEGYYGNVQRGLQVALKDLDSSAQSTPRGQPQSLAAIVFGSDQGLCGRFNEEIAHRALEDLRTIAAAGQQWRLLAVGARLASILDQAGQGIDEAFPVPGSAARITATVQQLLVRIDEWCPDAVYLFYNQPSGGKGYEPGQLQLLPIDLHRFRRLQEAPWPSRSLPSFTQPSESLLRRLLHQYLFVSIFRACAQSLACEHASRLAAMQAAERNLEARREEVNRRYRRTRQTVITAELLDVVAGFEVISGNEPGTD